MADCVLTDPVACRIAGFLEEIGITVLVESIPAATFLAGLAIRGGCLIVDPDRLEWPGDLLHEAGHIAVSAPELRPSLETLAEDGGDEMAAIAWSWAAALALGIAPDILFHQGGYKGGSQALVDNFGQGRFIGVPLLQLYEMSIEPHRAEPGGPAPYPHMIRWLR
jgi:hypothetical protein